MLVRSSRQSLCQKIYDMIAELMVTNEYAANAVTSKYRMTVQPILQHRLIYFSHPLCMHTVIESADWNI